MEVRSAVVGAAGDRRRKLVHGVGGRIVPMGHHLDLAGLRTAAQADTGLGTRKQRRLLTMESNLIDYETCGFTVCRVVQYCFLA